VISTLWGNTAYYVKLSGDDLSCYSNKIEIVGLRIMSIITNLTALFPSYSRERSKT